MAQNPINPVLTRFARARSMGAGGVGTRLFPLIISETGLSGEYAVFPRQRGVEEVVTLRGRGAKVKTTNIEDYTTEAYKLADHTIDAIVPIEDTIVPANLGSSAQLLNKFDWGAAKAQRMIMTAHERQVFAKTWAGTKTAFETIYTVGHVADAAAKWDATTSKARADVLKGSSRIYESTGYKPNTLLIPDLVFNTITSTNNELRDILRGIVPGAPSLQFLASYFGVPNIIVPQFLVDSANSGQAENFAQLWNGVDAVGLFYVDPNPSNLSDTLGSTFYLDVPETPLMGVQPWWNQERKSWMARCGAYFETKMVDNLCGYIIWDVLT